MKEATDVWLDQLEELYHCKNITIRNQVCREKISDNVVVDMRYPFVRDAIRKISESFRYAEAYWILSGDNRVSSIAPYAPSIEHFSDNGYVFQGAYGPKVTEQLRYVVDSLEKDLHTRQAVLTIWRENPRDSKDIPCTVALQFLVREGRIHCVATMRSSDVWLGLPYDIFNFSCITNWVCLSLDKEISLGSLTINMGSSHLYERNYITASKIVGHNTDDGWLGECVRLPHKGISPDEFIAWLRHNRDQQFGLNNG